MYDTNHSKKRHCKEYNESVETLNNNTNSIVAF